ncbi:hypothetical protein K3495_g16664, partial [Podosphaera aphanis]
IKIKNLEDNLQKSRDQTANLLDQNMTMLDKLDVARSNQVGGVSVRAPHRSTSDPEKFDASEKDSAKRQDQYITWRTRIGLNFAEDSSYFCNEKTKILNILRCLGGDVYTLNRDLLDQVSRYPTQPKEWSVKTAVELIEKLDGQYETLDLAQDAAIKFDNLQQGTRPFQNFLANFVALAAKCRKTEYEGFLAGNNEFN